MRTHVIHVSDGTYEYNAAKQYGLQLLDGAQIEQAAVAIIRPGYKCLVTGCRIMYETVKAFARRRKDAVCRIQGSVGCRQTIA